VTSTNWEAFHPTFSPASWHFYQTTRRYTSHTPQKIYCINSLRAKREERGSYDKALRHALTTSDIPHRMTGLLLNSERIWKEVVWCDTCRAIIPASLSRHQGKPRKSSSQDSRCPDRDSNPAPPDHKSGALPLSQPATSLLVNESTTNKSPHTKFSEDTESLFYNVETSAASILATKCNVSVRKPLHASVEQGHFQTLLNKPHGAGHCHFTTETTRWISAKFDTCITYIVLYFSILLHSFNTEYLFFCPSM
jgi:hypothetical protein